MQKQCQCTEKVPPHWPVLCCFISSFTKHCISVIRFIFCLPSIQCQCQKSGLIGHMQGAHAVSAPWLAAVGLKFRLLKSRVMSSDFENAHFSYCKPHRIHWSCPGAPGAGFLVDNLEGRRSILDTSSSLHSSAISSSQVTIMLPWEHCRVGK